MRAKNYSQAAEDYRRIEKAIKYIEANFRSQPSLDDIARSANLSKYHFQRVFKRWAGISPIQFVHYMTLDYTRKRLAQSGNLLDVSFDAGLSGPGRLHDLFVNFEAMTPGDFKRMGRDIKIEYGFHPTPFGQCLLAATGKGICHLGFIDRNKRASLNHLKQNWPQAVFSESAAKTASIVSRIFDTHQKGASAPFHLFIKGTNFQVNVWRALLSIPRGNVVSYGDIASLIGRPKAVRAAASAIAVNPVAYLIPCHRVIAGTGVINKYRYGSTRKKAIIGWEAAGLESR